jgi:DNA segregation ATPase FtsK/SpoIIIE, S-DNA-T family
MANAAHATKDDRSHGKVMTSESEARDIQRDAFALTLAAVTLMLVVSVVTRNPADPISAPVWPVRLFYSPDATHYPLNETITNACGYWGALISGMLVDAVGVSVALVIAAGGGMATALLTRGGMNAPVLRSLGGTLVVVATSTAAALSGAQPEGYPAIGAGGYLGAMASTWLEFHFATPGAWILTLTALSISLLMVTDYALWYAGWIVFRNGAMVSRKGLATAGSVVPRQLRKANRISTDLDAPVPIAGQVGVIPQAAAPSMQDKLTPEKLPLEQEPSIKIRNRPKGNEAIDASAKATPAKDTEVAGDESKNKAESTGVSKLAAAGLAAAAALGIARKAGSAANANESSSDAEEAAHDALDAQSSSAGKEQEAELEPVTRDLVIAGEEVTLRSDEAHDATEIKIKVPKKREELQAVFDTVNEDLPEGADDYRLPSLELLDESDDICNEDQIVEVRRKGKILEQTFKNFGFNIRVVEIETGPVISQYEVELEAGLRLSKITSLADDLAIALRVPSVRIVAPIPGKNTVGIEVPNEQRQVVRLREVIEETDSSARKMNIPVFLGKDVSGNPLTVDLAKMPHLLIAGRTGTGKSVCLNAIITSILMTCRPDDVRMLMIDPKMVELSGYARLPHLMHPVVTDMKKAEAILAWAVEKMEERYSLLAKAGVRHINSYNDLGREELFRRLEVEENDGAPGVPEKLPFIVIIADEMADLMMTAGKEVETHIIRLAQKSRAVGIHLILATQKPTVDVITGLIKSNLPARLSFQVASKTDSRVVLDENGADKLLGNGDMLFLWPGTSVIMRGQGTYLSDAEIDRVVDHCSTGEQNFVGELMNLKIEDPEGEAVPVVAGGLKKRDELYESAIEIVIREGRGSVSLLQRCLGIGYGRAARLIDYMAEDGLVGEYNGSQAREVTITMADWERMQGLESTAASGGDDEP